MKKLLYISEHKFLIDNCGKLYTTSDATNVYFDRYRNICDKIILVASAQKTNITDLENKSSISQIKNDDGFFEFHICEAEKPTTFVSRGIKIKLLIKNQIKKCDAIVMKVPSVSANTALRLAKKLNKPLMFEMVGCPWDALWNYGNIQGKILAPVMYLKTKATVKKAPFVLYVTEKFLQKHYSTFGESIVCSDVIIENLSDDVLEKRIEHIKQKSGKLILGTAAGINVKYKGQQYVIDAIYKLKQKGIDRFEYQILGSGKGDYLKALVEQKGLQHNVKFMGSLRHDQVFDWLDNIDIYIQPSKTEGLPRAFVEAMSRGLPALGSNVGGIPELISEEYLFSKGNSKQIANMLEYITKDKLINMAKENFDTAKNYTPNVLSNRRSEFYKKFVESVGAKVN